MSAEAGPSRPGGGIRPDPVPVPAPVPASPNGKQKSPEEPEHNAMVGFAAGIFSGWTKVGRQRLPR
jgi:hypothetical protein